MRAPYRICRMGRLALLCGTTSVSFVGVEVGVVLGLLLQCVASTGGCALVLKSRFINSTRINYIYVYNL